MAALLDWLRKLWARRDPLYVSEEELAEWGRKRQEKQEREDKRRAELEGDEELMATVRRVAQGCFAAPKEMRLAMVGTGIRVLQIPLANKPVRMGGYADLFSAENIELKHMPSWFMGKFYDLYVGYGPESKLVAWRVGDYQW